jgi:hypothetical protein
MLPLLFDENFNYRIVRGLRRRSPDLDLLSVQQAGLAGISDPDLLEWAAQRGKILVTHDISTIPAFAYERVTAEKPMSGVVAVPNNLSISGAISDLELILTAASPQEFQGRVIFLPL